LSNHHLTVQRALAWTTAASSSGAAVTLLTDWLPVRWAWVKPALSVITAGLSLWMLVQGYPKSAYDCADLQHRYRREASGP
jgi:hypothetical protein